MDQADLILFIRFNLVDDDCAKSLINYGNIDPNEYGQLPIDAESGGGDLRKIGYPFTPVQLAMVYGKLDMLDALVDCGGELFPISDGQLVNALCFASMNGQVDLARAVMCFRAFNINVHGSDFSHNPLQLSLIFDNPGIMKILLEDSRLDLVSPVSFFNSAWIYLCLIFEGKESS